MKINAKILSDKITPEMLQPKTSGSAGIDLKAVNFEDDEVARELGYKVIYPGDVTMIGSGISIHLSDSSHAALILPRSGLGHKHGIVLGNLVGLIDSDYQGELRISVWNRSPDPVRINVMDRIAQLIIIPVIQPEFNFVESFEQTERGSNGFGSTGVNILSKD